MTQVLPTLGPTNYQEVRKTLSWYAGGLVFLLVFIAMALVVPEAHRIKLESAFDTLPDWLVSGVGPSLVIGAISALLIGVLDIHDKVYDSWIIRWRERYDLDVVLPALLRPIASSLPSKFWAEAERDRRYFMNKLFYPFVADRDGVISDNRRIRFWERAAKYWITQITEMGMIALAAFTAVYATIYMAARISITSPTFVLIGVMIGFVIVRWFRRKALVSLRNATIEEIEEIHERAMADLQERVDDLLDHLNLRRISPPNASTP